MNKLVWELFEMVRELMPPTQANAERFQRWAEKFHALDNPPAAESPADEDEPDEDPHEHGAPVRRRRK